MKLLYTLISLVVTFTLVTACIATESDVEDKTNTTVPIQITIGDILTNTSEYEAQIIEVTGIISSQCGSGCWFILSDESGSLYVNLKPNNFVIPPGRGKEATVTGTLKIKDSDAYLIGDSVLLEGNTYP